MNGNSRRRGWIRSVAVALLLSLQWQAAWSAASLLAQEPLFVRATVQPNVMLLFDDSFSMAGHQLPVPFSGAVPRSGTLVSGTDPLTGWSWNNQSVRTASEIPPAVIPLAEWTLRSPGINPLWYNPAVTYKPWNSDADAGGSRFPNAGIGGTGTTATATAYPPWDMRLRPNTAVAPLTFTPLPINRSSCGSNCNTGTVGSSDVTVTLSNPPGYVLYPAMAWEGARNRDLFTRQSIGGCLWTQPGTPERCTSTYSCAGYTYTYTQNYNCNCTTTPDPRYEGRTTTTCQTCTQQATGCSISRSQQCQGVYTPATGSTCRMASPSLAPARWYRFVGDYSSTLERADPSKYVRVEINRAESPRPQYPVFDAATGRPAVRSDCTLGSPVGSVCTWEQEAQNFANWYTYYRNRMFAAIGVMSEVLSTPDTADVSLKNIRLGYGRINYFEGARDPWNPDATIPTVPPVDGVKNPQNPGALQSGVRLFTPGARPSDRSRTFDWLFSLQWTGQTPNREAIDAAGRYFTRKDSHGPWGDYPGRSVGGERAARDHLACRRNFTMLFTDGEWTRMANQPLLEDFAGTNATDGDNFNIPAGVTALNADNLNGPTITGDGPNSTRPPYTWRPSDNKQFSGGSSKTDTRTLTDVTTFYWNRDLRPDLPNAIKPTPTNPAFWQHMVPLIVGYGLTASMNTADTAARIAAGTEVSWPTVGMSGTASTDVNRVNDTFHAAVSGRGAFYGAADPEALRVAITSAFKDVQKETSSGTGVSATSASVAQADRIYSADFTTGEWSGRVYAHRAVDVANALLAGTGMPAPVWTSSIPTDPSTRKVFTSTARRSPADFAVGSLTSTQTSQLGTGLPLTCGMDAPPTAADVVAWLRGDRSREAPAGCLRGRTTVLGDIVNSTPLYSRAPNWGYRAMPAGGGGSTYDAFVTDNRATRRAAVYVGANDGMFHAFDANDGKELFAYVPRAVYRNLAALSLPAYQHRYFVDGPTVQGDAYLNGAWRSVVLGSTGAGGPGLFAIDATRPEAMSASSVLWDITQDDEPDLGSVLGEGVIGSTRDGSWVAIVGNGYESVNERAVLLVIDLRTGSTLRKIATPASYNAGRNGLGALTPVYDAARNVVAVWAGDKAGNLWKFDLSSDNPSQWKIATPNDAPVFRATNASNEPQAISTAPRLVPHPLGGMLVAFGTGKLFERDDTSDASTQAIYVVWERPQSPGAAVSRGSLRRMSFTSGYNERTLSGGPMNWRVDNGWYVELGSPGERIIANPVASSASVHFTSWFPENNADSCDGEGRSWTYALDLSTAQARGTLGSAYVGGAMPLSVYPAVGGPKVARMTRSELDTLMRDKYDAKGKAMSAVEAARARCLSAGSNSRGQLAGLPTSCAPLIPVRTYRQQLR